MAWPTLDPKPDTRGGNPNGESTIWAIATGVPTNGVNVLNLPFVANGIPADQIDINWMDIEVTAGGPSVTGAQIVGLSVDKTQLSINFAQSGADPATVEVNLTHTVVS